jgi:hypothetical protein
MSALPKARGFLSLERTKATAQNHTKLARYTLVEGKGQKKPKRTIEEVPDLQVQ